MRFTALFAAASIAVSSVSAGPLSVNLDLGSVLGIDLTAGNFYGAPIRPWEHGAKPGWYYGQNPNAHGGLTCLSGILCKILDLLPQILHCPKPLPPNQPSDGYNQTFSNLTGATQADDYMTYGLVDTIADCKAMCNDVPGCSFVNTYHDVNGKDGSTQLTCALFRACHTASDADNKGGQTQPDGSVDFITNSDGFCKYEG